jgi:hypothetical protein
MSHGVNCDDKALGLQNSFVHEETIPKDGVPLGLDAATLSNVQVMAINMWNIEENQDIIEVTIA